MLPISPDILDRFLLSHSLKMVRLLVIWFHLVFNLPPSGYYLATAADDSCVKLWDLRKLKNFKTLQLEDGYEVRDLCFDSSGTYLAVAGSDVRVYLCKQWNELKV
jgi:WD40 repeat protein